MPVDFKTLISMKKLSACLLTAMLAIAVSSAGLTRLNGQAATASIQGVVTDASNAAVPDASVQVRNVNTGATQTTATSAQGRFLVPDLGVGEYEVQAAKMGFQTVVRKGITLTVGAQSVVDFSLPVGQQQQTVTVEGQASQVETTDAAVGTLTDQKQMTELPLNGRNFEQLIQISPGVNTIAGNAFSSSGFQGRAPEYSIAGSRPEGQALLLDDENLQNFWDKGMGSVMGSSLGVEAIGEFQTLTNTYSAQFGGNGGVINAVSKSGTNNFHGSLYEFFRNSDLDARQFIDPSTIPAYRQNQYGGSIGGPIKKDKTFFFFNYEGVQLVQGETAIAFVPGCNLPGVNCTPTASNPATAQAIRNTLQVWPAATMVVNGEPEALSVANRSAGENYFLGRFDYNISSKNSLFARYISDKANYLEPFGGGGFAGGSSSPNWPEQDYSHTQFATLEFRTILSPTLVNVARVSFSRPGTNQFTAKTAPGGLDSAGTDPLQFFGPSAGRQDGIVNITGLSGIGGALQLPFNTTQNRYTEGDDIIWTHGAHNIRIGASISRLQSNTYMPFFDGSQWNFSSLQQFLGGVPNVLLFVPLGSYPNRDFRDIEFNPYVQDDWKISSKLTLNLGLRWEFITDPVDALNQLYYVPNVATAVNPANPSCLACGYYTHLTHAIATNPAWKNFDPRFGFAYDPFADHKTSIRGGFGIFHQPISVPDIAPAFWAAYPWAINALPGSIPVIGAVYPNIPTGGFVQPSSTPGWDYYANSTPYVIQYNLNVQRQIAPSTVLTVGYVGSRGLHLLTQQENNPPLVCSYAQGPGCANPSTANGPAGGYFGFGTPGNVTSNPDVNPALGSFPNLTPEAWSRFNSMLVSVAKRFSRDFQMSVSYTWSRCIDDGNYLGSFSSNSSGGFMDPYNLNLDKGVCSYDQTHVVKANGLWALPFHGNRFVEGWQISGILSANSGLPVDILDGYDEATGGGTVAMVPRPNYTSGCQVQVGKVSEWYNPQCFTLEAPGTLGDLGRDTVRGPGFFDTDLAVLKATRLRENLNLQFRAEFFNIFNHTNYGLPLAGMGGGSLFVGGGGRNPGAGQITTETGTPRQIQFALKLVF
jgi:hypothetical protein